MQQVEFERMQNKNENPDTDTDTDTGGEVHPLVVMALPYAQLLSQLDAGYNRLEYVQKLIDRAKPKAVK